MLRSRLAPTPSGFLHRGNAYNFLLTEKIIREAGGRLRLRIDDGDSARMRPECVTDVFASLHWLDIEWEDGPRNPEDQERIYSQTLQGARYEALLQRLKERNWLYACTCSRKEIAASAGTDGQYAGTCRGKALPLDTPGAALRLRTPADIEISWPDDLLGPVKLRPWEVMRDFVVWRRDGTAAYQLATVADDVAHQTSLIMRGADLLASTAAQLWLARCAEWPEFEKTRFLHHPLIRDMGGDKLSKSAGSDSLKKLHEQGTTCDEFRQEFLVWMRSLQLTGGAA